MFNKIGIGLAVLGVVSFGVCLRFVHPKNRKRGVSDQEVPRLLPGDEVIPNPSVTATRAVTIEAPPEQVWPALLQGGSTRDFQDAFKRFDHETIPGAEKILPASQQLDVGHVSGKGGFTVQAIEPPRLLLLTSHSSQGERAVHRDLWFKFGDRSWSFVLEPVGEGHTRLISQVFPACCGRSSREHTSSCSRGCCAKPGVG